MKKLTAICLGFVLILTLFGCGSKEAQPSETAAATEPAVPEYGLLQELVHQYGFPFELRFTEGMELTCFRIEEASAISNRSAATVTAWNFPTQ